MAIFNIYHVSTPFLKLRGCGFLYFFSLRNVRNEVIYLILEHSSIRDSGRLNKKTWEKFWPLNFYYNRCDWKTWRSKDFSEALTSKLWSKKKKKNMLLKFTEMERNLIIFTPYNFIKNLRQIHLTDSHVK